MENIYSSKEKKKKAAKQSNSFENPENSVSDISSKSANGSKENVNFSDYQRAAQAAAEQDFENTNQLHNENDVYFSSYSKQDNNQKGAIPEPTQSAYINWDEEPSPKKIKSRSSVVKKVLLAVCSLVLVAVIAFGAVINQLLDSVSYNQTGHNKNVFVNESQLHTSKDVTNILLVGVDRRKDNDKSRSDTIILLSIDRKNQKLKMTSFLRDSWVDIPGKKHHKLNSSCTWGGVQLLMDTLEYNFNVKIDHYMMVDFKMFTDIVDKLGGIDVEVTEKEAKYLKEKVNLNVKAGKNEHLTGGEALWYCRIRYLDNDLKRSERQRKVLTAILDKTKHQKPAELLKIAKEVLPDIETDMSKEEIATIGVGALFQYIKYDIEQIQIPKNDTWKNATKNGMAVLELDFEKNKQYLYDFIYGNSSENTTNKKSN